MNSTMQTEEHNKVKLTITVDAETFEAAVQKAYLKMRKRIQIPGWSKKGAPRKMIESYYGKEVFYSDAMEGCWVEAYEAALEENNVKPVSDPDVDVVSVDENGFVFTAEFYVAPEITLGQYKGVEATKVNYTIPEKMVEDRIQAKREELSTTKSVERAAQNGDTAVIDYLGTVDGVAFEGGAAENYELTLGSNSFIPGFEEQVVGHSANEEFDINVKFPEEYHAEDLKGKDAVFHINLHDVMEKVLPELDDEFVKDVDDECDTLDEYRKKIADEIQANANTESDNMLDNAIFGKIVDAVEVEIPESMTDREAEYLVADFERQLQYQGLSLDMFMQYTNSDRDQLKANYKDQAEQRVKSQLVLDAIVKAENIEVSDDEIQKEIEEGAKTSGQNLEEFAAKITETQKNYIREELTIRKTFEMLKNEAVITEEERVYGEPVKTDAEIAEEAVEAVEEAVAEVEAE